MIAPASTSVPSNTFTPSRLAAESRPLRVEPPPLVFDMSGFFLRARGGGRARRCGRARGAAAGDAGDLDRRVLLAMAPAPAAVGLVLVCEAPDLRAFFLAHHPGRHGGAGQVGWLGRDRLAVDQQER